MSQDQVVQKLSVDVIASEPSTVTISRGVAEAFSGGNHQDFSGLIHNIQIELASLQVKYDSVISLMSPIMTGTENAINYSTIIVTAISLFLAGIALIYQVLSQRDKKKSIEKAISDVDAKISSGLIPENSRIRTKIVETVLNSPEFILAVQLAIEYSEDSESAASGESLQRKTPEKSMSLQKLQTAKDSKK